MFGVGRDLCGSPSPTPCQSRVIYSRLNRTLSRWVLNISREGDSTTCLGSLGQGSITLRGKKFFLMFSWIFPPEHQEPQEQTGRLGAAGGLPGSAPLAGVMALSLPLGLSAFPTELEASIPLEPQSRSSSFSRTRSPALALRVAWVRTNHKS